MLQRKEKLWFKGDLPILYGVAVHWCLSAMGLNVGVSDPVRLQNEGCNLFGGFDSDKCANYDHEVDVLEVDNFSELNRPATPNLLTSAELVKEGAEGPLQQPVVELIEDLLSEAGRGEQHDGAGNLAEAKRPWSLIGGERRDLAQKCRVFGPDFGIGKVVFERSVE